MKRIISLLNSSIKSFRPKIPLYIFFYVLFFLVSVYVEDISSYFASVKATNKAITFFGGLALCIIGRFIMHNIMRGYNKLLQIVASNSHYRRLKRKFIPGNRNASDSYRPNPSQRPVRLVRLPFKELYTDDHVDDYSLELKKKDRQLLRELSIIEQDFILAKTPNLVLHGKALKLLSEIHKNRLKYYEHIESK